MFLVANFFRFPLLHQKVVFVPSDAPKPNRRSVFKNEVAIGMKSDEAFPASRSFVQEFKGRQRLDIFGQKLGGEFKPTASVIARRFKVRWQRLNLDASKVNSSRLDAMRDIARNIDRKGRDGQSTGLGCNWLWVRRRKRVERANSLSAIGRKRKQ
jgi:hypothetical protein